MDLYLGDSSDDEETYLRYSKINISTKMKKLQDTERTEHLSSFTFQEIAQSLIEHPEVRQIYKSLKLDALRVLYMEEQNITNYCRSQVDKHLFGRRIIFKLKK